MFACDNYLPVCCCRLLIITSLGSELLNPVTVWDISGCQVTASCPVTVSASSDADDDAVIILLITVSGCLSRRWSNGVPTSMVSGPSVGHRCVSVWWWDSGKLEWFEFWLLVMLCVCVWGDRGAAPSVRIPPRHPGPGPSGRPDSNSIPDSIQAFTMATLTAGQRPRGPSQWVDDISICCGGTYTEAPDDRSNCCRGCRGNNLVLGLPIRIKSLLPGTVTHYSTMSTSGAHKWSRAPIITALIVISFTRWLYL